MVDAMKMVEKRMTQAIMWRSCVISFLYKNGEKGEYEIFEALVAPLRDRVSNDEIVLLSEILGQMALDNLLLSEEEIRHWGKVPTGILYSLSDTARKAYTEFSLTSPMFN